MPYFGPSGNSALPETLYEKGLTAYEYQFGRGVRIGEKIKNINGGMIKYNISLSVHAPYYISLSNSERLSANIKYVLESCAAARILNANRIVVHCGSSMGMERGEALKIQKRTVTEILARMDEAGYGDIRLCPETMGKQVQLGTAEEVAGLCSIDERLIPTVDFGHINARTSGGLKTYQDFSELLDAVENSLGFERLKNMHCHFSKIEFTGKGEKKHLTFADTEFGPDYRPLMELIYKRGLNPVIICESDDTQTEDAFEMKEYYCSLRD